MNKHARILSPLVWFSGVFFLFSSHVFALDLPEEDCGTTATDTCQYFGDFTVYSLPLLDYYQSTSSTALYDDLQGLDLTVRISEIDLWISNNNGQSNGPQGRNTGIDDPYDAAQGAVTGPNVPDNLLFLMTSDDLGGQFEVSSDPNGGPTPGDNVLQNTTLVGNTSTYVNSDSSVSDPADYLDYDGTFPADFDANDPATYPECYVDLNGCLPLWDADLGELRTALDGGDLVFLFRNNETGDAGSLVGQDLLAWMRVCLSTADGSSSTCFTVGENTATYEQPGLTPEEIAALETRYDAQTMDVDDILPTEDDLWAHVHSDLCVLNDGTVLLGACHLHNIAPADGQTINQSLGQNEATYAITSKELNDLIYNPNSGYDIITVDERLSWLNNGGDWLGITSVPRPAEELPVPGTLALYGLGLMLLGLARRRKQLAS